MELLILFTKLHRLTEIIKVQRLTLVTIECCFSNQDIQSQGNTKEAGNLVIIN